MAAVTFVSSQTSDISVDGLWRSNWFSDNGGSGHIALGIGSKEANSDTGGDGRCGSYNEQLVVSAVTWLDDIVAS